MSTLTMRFIIAILAIVVLAVTLRGVASQAENATVVPIPVVDEPAGTRSSEIAVLAGGCFWGVQAVYQHLNGVTSAVNAPVIMRPILEQTLEVASVARNFFLAVQQSN